MKKAFLALALFIAAGCANPNQFSDGKPPTQLDDVASALNTFNAGVNVLIAARQDGLINDQLAARITPVLDAARDAFVSLDVHRNDPQLTLAAYLAAAQAAYQKLAPYIVTAIESEQNHGSASSRPAATQP